MGSFYEVIHCEASYHCNGSHNIYYLQLLLLNMADNNQ